MGKKYAPVTANVVETKRPTVAGADRHPGWHALRKLAARITTPLLPDDYLHLANPLWSARELRGRILQVRRETRDSATLVIKPGWGFSFDYQPGQYIGIGLLVDGRWRWRSYSLTSSPAGAARSATADGDHHRQGDARRLPVQPPGGRRRAGDHRAAGRAPGQFRIARPGAAVDPVPHRRVRDHAGDVDAANIGAPQPNWRHHHLHSAPTESDVMFASELTALAADQPGYRLQVRETRAAGSARPHPARRQRCRTGANARPGPVGPRAC